MIQIPYVQAFMAFYQDSGKREIQAEIFTNALPKSFSKGLKQKIPWIFPNLCFPVKWEVTGKEVRHTWSRAWTPKSEARPGNHELRPRSHGIWREVTHHRPQLLLHVPLPYGQIRKQALSSKLRRKRSSQTKGSREVPDGEGELCTFMFHSLCKTLPNARNTGLIFQEPQNLRMNLGILALTSPLTWRIYGYPHLCCNDEERVLNPRSG